MPEFPLDILLKIIKLARSTYYYHLKQLNLEDKNQAVKNEIETIYNEHKGNYGYREGIQEKYWRCRTFLPVITRKGLLWEMKYISWGLILAPIPARA